MALFIIAIWLIWEQVGCLETELDCDPLLAYGLHVGSHRSEEVTGSTRATVLCESFTSLINEYIYFYIIRVSSL